MKYSPFIIFAVAIVLVALYSGSNGKEESSVKENACAEPLTYRITQIDPRFGVSENEVIEAMEKASEAWSEVVNKPVAKYSEQGEIKVQLVYDHRQKFIEEEISFRERLKSKERQISSLKSIYDSKNETFERKLKAYRQQEEAFEEQLKSFNAWVKEKNRAGGFREHEVSTYEQKQAEIGRLREQINTQKKELNRLDDQLSQRVDKLNEVVDENNRLTEAYNQKYSGEKHFIQGEYEAKGSNKRITVYQFMKESELRLVLAHELGHALGIKHVPDKQAVMFDHTQDQTKKTLKLTEQDKEAILDVCNMGKES